MSFSERDVEKVGGNTVGQRASEDVVMLVFAIRDSKSGTERSVEPDTRCIAVPRNASAHGAAFHVRILDQRTARVRYENFRGEECYREAPVVTIDRFREGEKILLDTGTDVEDGVLARVGYRVWAIATVLRVTAVSAEELPRSS